MIQAGVWHRERESGFTLVELLVTMVISLVVMGGIYSTYYSQQKSYLAQEQVAAMQQNLRAAMYNIADEIRMAGYDATGSNLFGLVANGSDGRITDANNIYFTLDWDGDGVVDVNGDEQKAFRLNNGNLEKYSTDAVDWQTVAENIDALNFAYLDEDGNVTANLSDIRSIEVSIVARTGRGDLGYTNIKTYKNLQSQTIYTANDNFRRRLLTCEIKSRNLGLGL